MTKLAQLLAEKPDDAFLNFAMAMEHKKLKQTQQAVELFRKTLAIDPKYVAAFHQQGLAYEEAAQFDQAKAVYQEGIVAAKKAGELHAAEEMEIQLSMLG
jgi:Tfp pilus assembly protein PilF